MRSSAVLEPCVGEAVILPWQVQEAWRVSRKFPLVLLAEDERELRQLVAETLVEGGYQVVQVEDGVGLLEVLGRSGTAGGADYPDLVISDVRMPGLSGLDALSQVREVDPLVPMVIITAFADATTHAQARRLGVAAVVDKPFPMQDLLHLVRRLAPPSPP